MPPRSTVYTLDESVRAELDRRIVAAGFGRYADHAAWLAGQGYAISEAAIQRYGKRLRRSAERDTAQASEDAAAVIGRIRHSTEMARAINEAAGDDPLAMSARAAELCMVRLYEIAAREDIDAKTLQAISRSLNDSMRAVSAIRSEREEVRKQALREARQRAGGGNAAARAQPGSRRRDPRRDRGRAGQCPAGTPAPGYRPINRRRDSRRGRAQAGMKGAPDAGRRPLSSPRALPKPPRAPSIAAIQRHATARYGLTVGDLTSARKERRATRARHIAMWLCRALTRHGATKIGTAFGGRDHSTVAAAWRGLEQRMAADAGLKAEVEALRVSILAGACAQADTAGPTLRNLALAALDQARIAETEVARCRATAADLLAALEASEHADG